MDDNFDYQEDLKIDKNALDEECMKQPSLYEKYSSISADALSDRDVKKLRVEEIRAQIDREIRQKALNSGAKVTEKQIESEVTLDSRLKEVTNEYLEAKKVAETTQIIKESFQQKKDMLKVLADLYISNYFSTVESKNEKDFQKEGIRKVASNGNSD